MLCPHKSKVGQTINDSTSLKNKQNKQKTKTKNKIKTKNKNKIKNNKKHKGGSKSNQKTIKKIEK